MNKYFYYLLLTLTCYNTTVIAQDTNTFEKAVLAALDSSNYYTYDEFFGASDYDSLNVKDQYLFAEAARKLGAYGLAEDGYRRTIHLDSLEDKAYIPQAIYWMGAMKKLQGDYENALPLFDQFLECPPPLSNHYLRLAKEDKEDCRFALERTKSMDGHYDIRHLGENINSKYSDFAPLLIGEKLYFSSLKYELPKERVSPPRLFAKTLVADTKTLVTDTSLSAQVVDQLNNKNETVAHVALSQNEDRIYFTQCNYPGKSRQLNCQLYYRGRKTDGTWSKAHKLPDHINVPNASTTQPATGLGEDGKEYLYFVSNRTAEESGLDIYYSQVLVEDFGPVKKHTVSTTGNDVTPFYHTPSSTLYFSSDSRTGLGGFDIFSLNNNTVKHEGYPLNSSFNDLYFTLNPSGDKGHFSSNRQGCIRLNELEMGCDDIFAVDFVIINLKVIALGENDQELLGTKVEIIEWSNVDCTGDPSNILEETHADNNEFNQANLKKNTWYQIIATKEGYDPDTICFNTNDIKTSTDIIKQVKLKPSIFSLDLEALVFDNSSGIATPLNSAIVQLENILTESIAYTEKKERNISNFTIKNDQEYCLVASAIGYSNDTLCFNTNDLEKGAVLVKRLYLNTDIRVLDEILPISLYFDNNSPKANNSSRTTTSSNYEDLFYPYYRKQNEFIINYSRAANRTEGERELRAFFENDLKNNYDTLGIFSEALISFLRTGQKATISIQGYASPLANPVANALLSSRRVNTIMNHFRTYNNGEIEQYIGKQLFLEEIAHGEGKADKTIPDDPINGKYSPAASRERRVEIIGISIGERAGNNLRLE